jgi:MoxR-like ATPase
MADGKATFYPFGEMSQALSATEPTVWLFDDLGQASPAVQAAKMQLLLARRVNGHVLPDCVTMIAATNRRVDRAGVTGILEPVKSRFVSIVELDADVDSWSQWALRSGIPAELIAFLRLRPELLSAFRPSADLTQSPSPRTWHSVAKLQALNLPPSIEAVAMAGAVGDGESSEYLAFKRMAAQLPSVDAILLAPAVAMLPTEPAALYAVSTALATRTNEQTIDRVITYLDRMISQQHAEFAVLTLRDAIVRCPAIQQTQAFIAAMCGQLGSLITGQDTV